MRPPLHLSTGVVAQHLYLFQASQPSQFFIQIGERVLQQLLMALIAALIDLPQHSLPGQLKARSFPNHCRFLRAQLPP